MDDDALAATRRALHGVAELIIAGPQYRAHGEIHLRATPGGFGGVDLPVRVEGTDLVWDGGRAPLAATPRELAAAAGLDLGGPGIYPDTAAVDPDERLAVDPEAARLLADWFARGDEALAAFAPDAERTLWPEHFDLAIAVDEVNYGVSPGDGGHAAPYAYVGPWSPPAPQEGTFWNVPFGALRPADGLPDAAAITAFFAAGRDRASALG